MNPDPLLDILQRFPNCRVAISSGRSRPKPREGDRRFFKTKGGWYVRRQVVARRGNGQAIGYQVRNGRPVFEWVREGAS